MFFTGSLLISAGSQGAAQQTAMDRYVATPDPSYRYELVKSTPGEDLSVYVIQLTSQTWRNAQEVDHPVWKHWLTVAVPKKAKGSTGMLIISGGSTSPTPPKNPDLLLVTIARSTKVVAAELRNIPNEPLVFLDENKPRREDEIIAYTWNKFLKTGQDTWPVRLAMTKAAVRAMDTVTEFCAKLDGGPVKVDKFIIGGGSKRGWTTWMAAAVDKRVAAIMPIAIDMLNTRPSFEHHYRAYGFWAPALKDYTDMGLMARIEDPGWKKLMKIEDPYEYRDRLTLPKYIINSAGDQYFLPDSSRFYFKDLKGENYLRYIPNSDHSLKDTDIAQSVLAYIGSVVSGTPRPRFSWKLEQEGVLRVKSETAPSEVKLWQANNPNARDFRLMTLGPVWKSSPLMNQGQNTFTAQVARPEKGWTAFFIELTFPASATPPLKFTTEVRVIPDTLPFEAPKNRPGR
jgi:PhoPQ-activated pathogenicity-related protein